MHQTEDAGKEETFRWIREGYLKNERESMIIAAQDKSISPLGRPRDPEHDVQTKRYFAGFEVLIAVTMKSIIVWNITLCSPVEVHRRFGESYYLHFQGRIFSSRRFIPWLLYRPIPERSRCRDSSVCIATGYGLDGRRIWVQLSARTRDFSLFHIVQTGSGLQPASYPRGIT
jgi:hypothetical protein